MNRQMGIYEIRNIQNNKVYIGSSKDIKQRWKQHKYLLKNNKHHSPHLQNAWSKYGEDNFKFQIIERVENEDGLLDVEQQWLDLTQCYKQDNGYNVSANSRCALYDGVIPPITEKKDIQIYISTKDEKYLTRVQSGDYKYVDKSKFIHDLYQYYENKINQREYIAECFLYSQGVYFNMKELIDINPDSVNVILKSFKVDLISFNDCILDISNDFYISKIIDYKYKILKRKDVLVIETVDKKYEIVLSGEE